MIIMVFLILRFVRIVEQVEKTQYRGTPFSTSHPNLKHFALSGAFNSRLVNFGHQSRKTHNHKARFLNKYIGQTSRNIAYIYIVIPLQILVRYPRLLASNISPSAVLVLLFILVLRSSQARGGRRPNVRTIDMVKLHYMYRVIRIY